MEVIFCPSCPRVPRLVSAVISSPVVSNICFCRAAELNLFLPQERRRLIEMNTCVETCTAKASKEGRKMDGVCTPDTVGGSSSAKTTAEVCYRSSAGKSGKVSKREARVSLN